MRFPIFLVVGLGALCASCNCGGKLKDIPPENDSGTPDAGHAVDGGGFDSGAIDSGIPLDAGTTDGGTTDAGPPCATEVTFLADAGTPYQESIAAVWNGSDFGLAWNPASYVGMTYTPEVDFGAIDSNGVPIPGSYRMLDGPSRYVALAWSGTQYGAVFLQGNVLPMSAWFERLDSTGAPVTGTLAQLGNNNGNTSQVLVQVAWSPVLSQWGVAWTQNVVFSSVPNAVHFVRLDASGIIPGSERTLDTNGTLSFVDPTSSVVANASGFAVAWNTCTTQCASVGLALIDSTGAVSATRTIAPPMLKNLCSALAWSGTEYGLLYDDGTGCAFYGDNLYFQRLDPSLNLLGSPLQLQVPSLESEMSAITWDGSAFAVAWQAGSSDSRTLQIYGARIDDNGMLPGYPVMLSCPSDLAHSPFVTSNGSARLLTFMRYNGPVEGVTLRW